MPLLQDVNDLTCRSYKALSWQPPTKASGNLMGAETWIWWGRGCLLWEREERVFYRDTEDNGSSHKRYRACEGLVHGYQEDWLGAMA